MNHSDDGMKHFFKKNKRGTRWLTFLFPLSLMASIKNNAVSPAAPTPIPKEGGQLKNFVVDKKIGKGQFSCVYRAVRTADNTVVALKKVPVQFP